MTIKMSMLKDFDPTFLIVETLGIWKDISIIAFNTPTGESIIYPPQDITGKPTRPLIASLDELRVILLAFQKEKAIKILHDYWNRRVPFSYAIEVIEPRFSELKDEIMQIYESKIATSQSEAQPKQTSSLQQRYKRTLADIKDQSSKDTAGENTSKPKLGDSKLEFNPDDGVTIYRGAEYVFTGKGRALLTFLYNSKNTPFSLKDIKEKCNPNINNKRFYFKAQKDVWDTVEYIKTNLKVKKSEFFPIKKSDENWIWIEK